MVNKNKGLTTNLNKAAQTGLLGDLIENESQSHKKSPLNSG